MAKLKVFTDRVNEERSQLYLNWIYQQVAATTSSIPAHRGPVNRKSDVVLLREKEMAARRVFVSVENYPRQNWKHAFFSLLDFLIDIQKPSRINLPSGGDIIYARLTSAVSTQ
ncbi:hypothetical protein GTR04_3131 [Trichophyton interdigitale]|uniref:Uncharacterized protein n=1 Tax=Trichophyton interdigitale TaxID=101480 RepID=A0A9P4YLU5_9EURO|nr:hypothetical protein GY631_0468 [Trichophyton interdigitale]KAF3900921.1 hypothetical protein GY632_0443 [Trichophyton interdigitale]KAG8209475.1 hypothetical protein GTR04_3131 [Trichophyton interdigitale]